MSRSSSELCTAWGAMGGVSVLAARSAGADAKHLRSMAYELPVGSFGRSPAGAPDADRLTAGTIYSATIQREGKRQLV